ncbi:centromere/kinetochore protein zw10 homolog [Lineus longissimus]|uniref:centromere/kinetochore protein zw10 homolog n=1 Tax=Lineus longissimus TaxID=88925 RepID=UPI002B4C8596
MAEVGPFVQAVLAAAGKSEKEDISQKMGKLSKKIEDVKYEVYHALHDEYDEFIPNLTATLELSNQVRTVSEDMQSLSARIEREIQSQLNVSATEYQDLSSRLQESNGILGILDKLVKIHDSLQAVKKSLAQNEFVTCANSLDKIHELVASPVDDRSKDIKILSALKTEYTVQRETLKHNIGETWKDNVIWLVPEKGDTNSGVVDLCVRCPCDSDNLLVNILQGMERVDILQIELKKFAYKLIKHVITPIILNSNSAVSVMKKKGQCLKVVCSNSGKVATPQETFSNLTAVLDFIQQYIFSVDLQNGQTTLQRLGLVLSKDMLSLIIEHCLAPSIPTNTRDLEPYKAVVQATEEFQEKLSCCALIGKENDELVKYVSNINVLFANKKCQDLLQKARTLMTAEIHSMVLVTEEEGLGDSAPGSEEKAKRLKKAEAVYRSGHLSGSTFKLPKCFISVSVQSLVTLAYETLHEACTSSQQCAVQLFYTVRNMFELYSTVVPTFHRDSLTKLPQLAALHHNNCMYIAHNLTTLGHQFRQLLAESLQHGTATFLDYVPMIRQLGTDCLLGQMSRQKEQLMECLQGANGFTNVAESDSSESSERAVKQVLFQLSHLQNVWQEVLPETVYFKAMGTLLNSTVVEIINCITALEDISADDATLLHSLFSIIVDRASSYFKSENAENNALASLQKYTPKWNKFKEMLLVLNAGLVEISDRWADGKGPLANEFSPAEVKQLIRALFQNTDRRSAVLSRIK